MQQLSGIRDGRITLVFRKWRKPTVKAGGQLKTAIGVIQITTVDQIQPGEISGDDARRAGYDTPAALQAALAKIHDGVLYRIAVHYHGADPRIALRNKVDVTDADFAEIAGKLERFDQHSANGPWTLPVLQGIGQYPEMRAVDLARKLHFEKDWMKINIRKLKNLGLTISHEVGYTLSPLGERFIQYLVKKGK